MALVKKIKSLYLDKAHPNAPYPEPLLQGSLDKILQVTLLDDNVVEDVGDSAEVTVIVLYNPRMEYDKFVKDGSFVMDKDTTGWDVTVSNGVISIPLHDGMVTYAGKNQLVLLIKDGFTTYSYQMDFEVARNNAYTEQSLPDNLPSYTNLQKQVMDLSAQSSAHEVQISGLTSDVAGKADSDLGNVGDFATIPDGGILMKKDGTIKHSDITLQGDQLMATDKVFNVKELKTAPNTISIGEAIKLKENGGALEIETQTVGKRWLVLDYENDPVNGTKKPVYYARAAKEQVTMQPVNTSNMVISSPVDFGRPQFDRQIQAIYFDFITAVKNFRMKITVNNKDLFFYPSKRAYDGEDKGLDMQIGINKIDFIPNFSNVTEYASMITFIADGPINVKGNGTLPWYKLDLNRITRHNILVDGDAGTETPEEMARGIEALEFSKKLSYVDGLKDKPVLPVATTDFDDMPQSLVGMAGKMLQVDAKEEGYELVDKPTGGDLDPDTVTFRHSLAIKAMNKTGNTINPRSFVMLSPKSNGRYNMIPITKSTKYSGEIIGIVESQTVADAEGQVNIITNYQTGVTGVSQGVAAYVGFTSIDPSDDSIDIGEKDNIAVIFGKCGVFGGTNDLGEYMANFNSFEVQAYYAVQSHHDSDIDYHDNLPGTIDKEALFVYLNDDISSAGGIVEQPLPQLSTVEKGMQIYVNNRAVSQAAKIRLMTVGADTINGAQTYDIPGGNKVLFIATVNGWVKFYDNTVLGGGDPDLAKKVAANTAEIDRLKTSIRTSALPTYTFRDRGVPASLSSGYKAYYIHSIVLQDSNQAIDIPLGLADGTIISIENNDRDDYLSLRPASGETINGNIGVFQCGHDTLNFFVKNNDDWSLAYGGIFPNSLTALKSTIQALLPNELNTIDEIGAQLKDRLHTFREIQNEFASQLHTLEEINKDMESRGFSKEGGKLGMQGDQSVPIDDSWSIDPFKANEEIVIPAQNKGNQYLVFTLPAPTASTVGRVIIDNSPMEFSEHEFVDNELHYKVFISRDSIDSSTTVRFKVEYKTEADIMVHWGLSNTNSITDDSWMIGKIYANEHVIPPIQGGTGNKFLVFQVPVELFPVIYGVYVGQDLIEFTQTAKAIDTFNYRVLVTSNQVDLSTQKKVVLNYDFRGSNAGSGITIDDGTTNKAGIKEIDVKGMYLDKVFDDSDKVELKSVTSFETLDGVGGGRVNRVLTEEPLLSVLDPNTKPGEEDRIKLYIQHDYFELSKPPGYLAYLSENEEIIGRVTEKFPNVKNSPVWFDNLVVGEELGYLDIDKPNKAIGIQDYTGDDPNVTGGVPTLIIFRAAIKGKAPNDGFIELLVNKTFEDNPTQDGGHLIDVEGNPIGVRKQFKKGDDIGVMEAAAIYMAKGLTKFQCIVEHDFVDDGVYLEDRTEGGSCLLIQALGKDYSTGDALLQFENDTMQNIEFSKHYNGEDMFNMAWSLGYDRADTDIVPGAGQTDISGLHFYNNTNLKIGVADKTLHIHDNGSDMCYFSLGEIFSAEKTAMLQNKELDIKVTLQDKDSGFRIYMVKWTGSPDKYTSKIIDHYDADAGAITEQDWDLDGNIFISEDAVAGEHTFAGTLTVPSDAVNFAVVMVPAEQQYPIDLYMKGFEIDVSEPFIGWILKAPELIGEKHLEFSSRHKELRCDLPPGLSQVRYTLNNVPAGQPMPIGILGKGKADIEIDHTINQVPGTSLPNFEGAIKFLNEGKAYIKTDLYVHSEKDNSILATTKFWYSKVSSDGSTFTKIPLSEYTTQVRGQTKAINNMPKFEIDVKSGDRIALFGTSDQSDGAFIDTTESNIPMLKTVIDFDEITVEERALIDKITEVDMELVVTDRAKAAGYYIELDYDPDQDKPILAPKKRS